MEKQQVYRGIAFGLFLFLGLYGCRKEAKAPIGIYITAIMPHTGEAVAGIRWKIVETKQDKPTGWELHGVTGGSGEQRIEFYPKRNNACYYDIYFDYKYMNVPDGDYEIVDGPHFDQVVREYMTIENTYNIRVLPYTQMHYVIDNVNCFDENDKMRYKSFNYDRSPNTTLNFLDYSPTPFTGCDVYHDHINNHVLAGHQVYQVEVTRNGIVNTYIDTFNVLPNVMNEVHILY
jgi:hypothetical protein